MDTKHANKIRHFKCTQCNLAFFKISILQNHLKCHDPKCSSELTCHVCYRGFTLKQDRDRHVESVHFKERNFSCEHCDKTFVNRGVLNAHIRQQHIPENLNQHLTLYQCKLCDSVSFGRVERRLHLKLVHKAYDYKCQICQKSFTSKQSFVKHARVHTRERPFTCDVCGKTFPHPENLKIHKIVHLTVRSFQCQTCGKSFLREIGLRDHTHNFHEKDKKRFICMFCPASYVKNADLEDHIRSHTQEKPYQCKSCSNCYQAAAGLRYHTRANHSSERKFRCEICEKAFPNRTNLNGHKLIHVTIKTEKKHECLYCHKSFMRRTSWRNHVQSHLVQMNRIKKWNCIFCTKQCVNNTNLNRHLLYHIRETPFMCGICRKEFTTPEQVRSHMASHTGERAYKCKICEASYPYPRSLKRHVMIYHQRMKPFQCVFCDDKYGTKEDLWGHFRGHIGEKPHFCPNCDTELGYMSTMKKHMKSKNCRLD